MATSLPSTSRWTCPWSGRMWVLVWVTILAPARPRWTSGVWLWTVWPLWGLRMVSLAVEAGRGPRAVVAGAAEPAEAPPDPEQPASSSTATARVRVGAVSGRWWRFPCMACTLLLDLLGEAGADGRAPVGVGVDGEGGRPGLEVDVGGEVAGAEHLQLDGLGLR